MKEETKAEARKRARREYEMKNNVKIGIRKPKSAKLSRPESERRSGICMTCHLPAYRCVCAGHMSEAAMNRFFEEQKKEKP